MSKNFLTLSVLSDFHHGFFCRHGGVSKGIFSSLDCQLSEPRYLHQDAEKNFACAQAMLGLQDKELHTIKLEHGVNVDEPEYGKMTCPQADASVSNHENILLAVTTADCLPLLIADPVTRYVSAVHVGWAGALHGIVPSVMNVLVSKPLKVHNICAGLGPCIAQEHLKLNAQIKQAFVEKDKQAERFFEDFHLDLRGYVAYQLKNAHVNHIESVSCDTYTNMDFFSARRARHRGEGAFGVQPSMITAGEKA